MNNNPAQTQEDHARVLWAAKVGAAGKKSV